MKNHQKIQQIADRQGIRYLLHFTLRRNLPTIIQHGILPRETLDQADFNAYTGAEKRLDGDDQVVSLSISAAIPNSVQNPKVLV